jgi:hypothetical protein
MNRVLDKFCEILSWSWLAKLIFGFGDAISPSGIPWVHVRYHGSRCVCIFGSLPIWALDQIGDVLRERGVSKAVIKQMRDGTFRFSRSVPQEIRQIIRNVIVSR